MVRLGHLTLSNVFLTTPQLQLCSASSRYGRALARYFLEQKPPGEPLRIFEIGGGTGTAALTILEHIRDEAPDVYRTATYTSVEVSSRLADRQRRRLWGAGHSERYTVEERDASAPWPRMHDAPCFVMALEVMDNLPHDRVVRARAAGASGSGAGADAGGGEWMETVVVEERRAAAGEVGRSGAGGGSAPAALLREEHRPLSGAHHRSPSLLPRLGISSA